MTESLQIHLTLTLLVMKHHSKLKICAAARATLEKQTHQIFEADDDELCQSTRFRKPTGEWYTTTVTLILTVSEDRQTYSRASFTPGRVHWKKAMTNEYSSLLKQKTWSLPSRLAETIV